MARHWLLWLARPTLVAASAMWLHRPGNGQLCGCIMGHCNFFLLGPRKFWLCHVVVAKNDCLSHHNMTWHDMTRHDNKLKMWSNKIWTTYEVHFSQSCLKAQMTHLLLNIIDAAARTSTSSWQCQCGHLTGCPISATWPSSEVPCGKALVDVQATSNKHVAIGKQAVLDFRRESLRRKGIKWMNKKEKTLDSK